MGEGGGAKGKSRGFIFPLMSIESFGVMHSGFIIATVRNAENLSPRPASFRSDLRLALIAAAAAAARLKMICAKHREGMETQVPADNRPSSDKGFRSWD